MPNEFPHQKLFDQGTLALANKDPLKAAHYFYQAWANGSIMASKIFKRERVQESSGIPLINNEEKQDDEDLLNLALCHLGGIGMLHDDQKAAKILQNLSSMQNKDQDPARNKIYILAQGLLAFMYEFGRIAGETQAENDQKAILLYNSAAEQGLALAKNNLALMYQEGRVLNGKIQEENNQEAFLLFTSAAEQGYLPAQYNLGRMFKYHQVVSKHPEGSDQEAVHFYSLCVEKGYALAQYALARMHEEARIPDKTLRECEQEASHLYTLSAQQAFAPAAWNLALLHRNANRPSKAGLWFREAGRLYLLEKKFKEYQKVIHQLSTYNLGSQYYLKTLLRDEAEIGRNFSDWLVFIIEDIRAINTEADSLFSLIGAAYLGKGNSLLDEPNRITFTEAYLNKLMMFMINIPSDHSKYAQMHASFAGLFQKLRKSEAELVFQHMLEEMTNFAEKIMELAKIREEDSKELIETLCIILPKVQNHLKEDTKERYADLLKVALSSATASEEDSVKALVSAARSGLKEALHLKNPLRLDSPIFTNPEGKKNHSYKVVTTVERGHSTKLSCTLETQDKTKKLQKITYKRKETVGYGYDGFGVLETYYDKDYDWRIEFQTKEIALQFMDNLRKKTQQIGNEKFSCHHWGKNNYISSSDPSLFEPALKMLELSFLCPKEALSGYRKILRDRKLEVDLDILCSFRGEVL